MLNNICVMNPDAGKTTKYDVEYALTELNMRETEYLSLKQDYSVKKNSLFINSDWSKINEERAEEGLDKLSSDAKKQAYIKTKLDDLKYKVVINELLYNQSKREYEQNLLFYKIENSKGE